MLAEQGLNRVSPDLSQFTCDRGHGPVCLPPEADRHGCISTTTPFSNLRPIPPTRIPFVTRQCKRNGAYRAVLARHVVIKWSCEIDRDLADAGAPECDSRLDLAVDLRLEKQFLGCGYRTSSSASSSGSRSSSARSSQRLSSTAAVCATELSGARTYCAPRRSWRRSRSVAKNGAYSRSSVGARLDSGQVLERGEVSGDDGPTGGA